MGFGCEENVFHENERCLVPFFSMFSDPCVRVGGEECSCGSVVSMVIVGECKDQHGEERQCGGAEGMADVMENGESFIEQSSRFCEGTEYGDRKKNPSGELGEESCGESGQKPEIQFPTFLVLPAYADRAVEYDGGESENENIKVHAC
ncbi:hypothetical protein A2635_00815 [Candidatus Peribacteria bacterium RIFCSPHIGHO2_01_FULL_51_9]|nr:MAG: hypothetical protein A2635_00815 [Candidatus Peribacteria bacterium RIFCSPHIGHO2_01_FULL_51_9]